ncbi:AAA family ATPase [Dictyobacter arantiisoli]|uniref:ATPase n=1 Tax=Dictyobacter arantiisoli TaxID=2014874 RepID=A0A5A5T921_9CHLR|nr:MoxR family ATPase [Dictyobacter arantiisoli]GCF07878.1 ATPase [Dictyobacter arantiisoli]
MQSVQDLATAVQRVVGNVEQVIVGKAEPVAFSLIAVICNGHILIEDVPGVGKTVLTKAIARSIGCSFKRIQFTPDLLPSDVTGVSIYSQKSGNFEFRPGPLMAQIVLADEVNRATPKTQSALLEAMEEGQITVDGATYHLPQPFMVMATQNPIEYEGTFPLPEAQLDRFMMTIKLGYPKAEDEINILNTHQHHHPLDDLAQIMTAEELVIIQQQVRSIHVDPSILEYIVAIANATRNHPQIYLGISPRGSLALFRASQALAAMRGRGYVIPDDVKLLVKPTLAHRIIVTPAARVRSISSASLLDEILQTVAVPNAWVGGGKGR